MKKEQVWLPLQTVYNKELLVASINEVIDKTTGRLDSDQAKLHLEDIYANANGIFDLRERGKRPLHSIAMHEAEENGLNSELFDAIKLFRDNQVYKHFGLSWNEMKRMTHEEFSWIMELAADATKKETVQADNAVNNLESQVAKGAKK